MNPYTKIRAALQQADALIPVFSYLKTKNDEALAALAELERASAEPVATVCLITDRYAHNHCIEAQLQVYPSAQLPSGTKLYASPVPPKENGK